MEGVSFFDHTGDLGFEVRATDLVELFHLSARGLYETLVETLPPPTDEVESVQLEEDAPDLLLRSFLSELLYRFLARRVILVDFVAMSIGEKRFRARGRVGRFDQARDGLRTELKAVTYHQLEVRRESSVWTARVIFDV